MTNEAQLTVYQHWSTKKALLISTNGDEKDAKWVQSSLVTVHQHNRNVLVITMPERVAVKKGLMPIGALTFGGNNNDSFTDKPKGTEDQR